MDSPTLFDLSPYSKQKRTVISSVGNDNEEYLEQCVSQCDYEGYCGNFFQSRLGIRVQIVRSDGNQITVFCHSQSLDQAKQLFCDTVAAVLSTQKLKEEVESPPQRAKHDSLTPLGVTESLVLTPLIDSLTRLLSVSESSDGTPGVVQSPVNIYTPRGSFRADCQYFRYSYRDGNQIRHRHIPGGNIHSSLAQSRRDEVEQAVTLGKSSEEIVQMISSWGRKQK
ncbi:MAG: hypothetical protein Fur006_69610 [Coleofasciculaceae cyanobacterium]